MSTLSDALLVVLGFAAHTYLAWWRLLAYLRYFQQEGYESLRFLKWTGLRPLTDPAFWLSISCVWLSGRSAVSAVLLFGAGAWLLARAQPDPRRSGKVVLRMTWRAWRVLAVSAILATALWAGLFGLSVSIPLAAPFVASATVFAAVPLLLMVANACLGPYERYTRAAYEADAAGRVRDIHPVIVGITGSYGKSSAKAMLAHVLRLKGPTLAATGSINTLMGVTRHVREELVFGHRFMVVEMGAHRMGSIRRLCELTPPSAALITAVGDAHLERFGSTDAIVKAKSELAQALPPGGLLVVNADSPGALRIARAAVDRRVLLYGETSAEDVETRLEQVTFSRQGTSFVLRTREGESYRCTTPLLGRPIILNLTGVFTLARALGVEPDTIVAAMRTLTPVSNRLEVVEENGITWIRDAYNSNQFGFRAALEVASALTATRRVLVTPGVIELGPMQAEVNRALSREAAGACDETVVVSDTNRAAFVAGHADVGRTDRLIAVANRTEAFAWLREHVGSGDLVILENDLPDVYERTTGVFWGR
jgi:UDP-N-acetylmuramoyl-tripeptide--D-alanyl-D-alanine ligase